MAGYILIDRNIVESEIWQRPPMYLKVWLYLLIKAQWKDYRTLERGQLWTSYDDIRNACSYYKGCVKVVPKKDEIFNILEFMRTATESQRKATPKATMITTSKATKGILINIVKYEVYQDISAYESNDESNTVDTPKATRKQRASNRINENKETSKTNNNKNICTNAPDFEAFWKAYPRKQGKRKAQESFNKINPDSDLLQIMLTAVEQQRQTDQWKRDNGKYIPMPTTWLNGSRWEDETNVQAVERNELDDIFNL